jgi:hypothetical protein
MQEVIIEDDGKVSDHPVQSPTIATNKESGEAEADNDNGKLALAATSSSGGRSLTGKKSVFGTPQT